MGWLRPFPKSPGRRPLLVCRLGNDSIVTAKLRIRCANKSDLPFINAVINAALTTWPISARAHRLFTGALAYDVADLRRFEMFVSVHDDQVLGSRRGVRTPPSLFPGLCVTPSRQRRGIGAALINTVFARANALGKEGLLIKSARASISYFEALSIDRNDPSADPDYPYTFWWTITFDSAGPATLSTPT